MKIKWSLTAERAWYTALHHIYDEFGYRAALKFRSETKKVIRQLQKFPQSGSPEDLLPVEADYRSIVIEQYSKLVYKVLDEEIHIDDIWDTRREPKKQAQNTMHKNK